MATWVSSVPEFLVLLSLSDELFVESTLEQLVVRDSFLELGTEAVGGFSFLFEATADVVEINLQVGQLDRQLVALLYGNEFIQSINQVSKNW